MGVSKRLRYEVFRRDGHACKYCGARAPQVPLTIDHIVPRTLGGTDAPENLAAACFDCNAGKSSTRPDDALVLEVEGVERDWQSSARPYRDAVTLLFGALPDFDKAATRASLAARFEAHHEDDEDPVGKPIVYQWPDELKAFAAAVEWLAERDWQAHNTIYMTLGKLAPGRVGELIAQARREFVEHDYIDFSMVDLERYALHLVVDALAEREPV